MKERNMSKEKRRERRKERRARCRVLKNLLIWFNGLIMGAIAFVLVIALSVALLPVSTFTGKDGSVVSSKVSDKTLIEAFMQMNEYSMQDFPVVSDMIGDLASDPEFSKFVEVDMEKLKTVKFVYDDGKDFGTELSSCFKIVATIDSVGGAEQLGDIGKISAFNEWEEVTDEEAFDADGNIKKEGEELTSNPQLYYYEEQTGGSGTSPLAEGAEKKYKRAFDDDGTRIAPDGAKLYYANLSKIPILEAVNILGDSFGRMQINELLSTFGAGEMEDSFIGDILDGKRVSDISSIDESEFLLSKFLGEYDTNKDLYDILCKAVKVEEGEERPTSETITLAHLKGGFNIDALFLTDVLGEYDTNKDLYDILCKAVKVAEGEEKPTSETLSIAHLKGGFDIDALLLTDVLGEINTDNKDLYDVLCDSVVLAEGQTKPTPETITLGHIKNGVNLDGIYLTQFLGEYDANKDLYDLLCDAVVIEEGQTKPTYDKLTMAHLKGGINIDGIYLTKFLGEYDANKDLYDMLCNAVKVDAGQPQPTYDKLTMAHLKAGFNFEKVKLSTAGFDYAENKQFYKILLEGSGTNLNGLEDEQIQALAQDLQVGVLTSFNVHNVKLHTVLDDPANPDNEPDAQLIAILEDVYAEKGGYENITVADLHTFKMEDLHLYKVLKTPDENLKKILMDAFDKDNYEDITVSMLTSSFSYNNISLSTVIGETSDNPILNSLLTKGVSVGEVSSEMDKLTLYEVYGTNCFVPAGSASGPRYSYADGVYTLSDSGEYAISKNAGIWLLLCFDVDQTVSDEGDYYGCAKSYKISTSTVKDLQGGTGNNVSSKFTNATVRQLIDAGIIDSANGLLYNMSLSQALNATTSTPIS